MTEIVFLSGARTAIGGFGGTLKDIPPTALGAHAAKAAITRAGIAPEDVGQCVFGNVIHTEARDMYLARVIGMETGVPKEAPALTVRGGSRNLNGSNEWIVRATPA